MGSNTGRTINYLIRPAKSIERKMLRDGFQRLFPFGRIEEYQYIGFGAKYFADFTLFHTSLNISQMISIEQDHNNKERYEFNKPFKCISLEYGKSSDVLHKLSLDKLSICWFDYDDRFSETILSDTAHLVENLPSGSIVALSYNSKPYSLNELQCEYGKEETNPHKRKYSELLGKKLLPTGFEERGMTKWNNHSKILCKSLNSHIESCLSTKNAGLEPQDKMHFRQIFYFDYKDGVEMSTVVFLLFSEKDKKKNADCKMKELSFYRDDDDMFKIEVPNLTYKEIKLLYENMPFEPGKDSKLLKVVTEKDIELFSKYYRYFPSFYEVQMV